MPIDVPGNQPTARPIGPTGAIISASRGQVLITGSGFLPNRSVTIRITYIGEDIVDYLTYVSDADGHLSAPLAGDRSHRNRLHRRHRPPPRPR